MPRPEDDIPYPPNPEDVPEGLTEPTAAYRGQVRTLTLSLAVFFLVYMWLIGLAGYGAYFCLSRFHVNGVVAAIGLFICVMALLFLIQGLFSSEDPGKTMNIEVTEREHPRLFEFIDRLCYDLQAPLPRRVYVSPDVNAAVMTRPTLINLFTPPEKDLLIGLGLINMLNLSEFKSVLAHEFGHFSQKSLRLGSYTYVMDRLARSCFSGDDWIDRVHNFAKEYPAAMLVVGVLLGFRWAVRHLLAFIYKLTALSHLAVSRQQEFNADLFSVSVAGSDAAAHALARAEYADLAFHQAVSDLHDATSHQLYTRDLFLHQRRGAEFALKKIKEDLPGAYEMPAGPHGRVFDEGREDNHVPPMWQSHPPNHARERNAKRDYVFCPIDTRSPWSLFEEPARLKAKVTKRFYRLAFKIRRDAEFADPLEVQRFIDDEHDETTFDPKYHGVYDGRPIQPGGVRELFDKVGEHTRPAEQLREAFAKLYDGLKPRARAHEEVRKELQEVIAWRDDPEKPRRKKIGDRTYSRRNIRRLVRDLEREVEEEGEWLGEFDRRVLLTHGHMAKQLGGTCLAELRRRYAFQVRLQEMYQRMADEQNRVTGVTAALMNAREVDGCLFEEAKRHLTKARRRLKEVIKEADKVTIPTVKNFAAGTSLGEFLLDVELVREAREHSIEAKWIQKLLNQMERVRGRAARLLFKNMGNILSFQERVAEAWLAGGPPPEADDDGWELVEEEQTYEVIDD